MGYFGLMNVDVKLWVGLRDVKFWMLMCGACGVVGVKCEVCQMFSAARGRTPALCCVTSDLIFDKGSECVVVLVLGGTWCGIGQDQKFRIVSIDFWLKLCYNRMGYFFFFFFSDRTFLLRKLCCVIPACLKLDRTPPVLRRSRMGLPGAAFLRMNT